MEWLILMSICKHCTGELKSVSVRWIKSQHKVVYFYCDNDECSNYLKISARCPHCESSSLELFRDEPAQTRIICVECDTIAEIVSE